MIFGDRVESPAAVAPTEWIAGACRGVRGTVGAFVPNDYALILRVHAPEPGVEDWWLAYRGLFELIAAVAERHSSSTDRAWFAVWEGHGFDTRRTHVARQGPLADATRAALEGSG